LRLAAYKRSLCLPIGNMEAERDSVSFHTTLCLTLNPGWPHLLYNYVSTLGSIPYDVPDDPRIPGVRYGHGIVRP
jgi:hypothetical protein